MFNIVIVGVGGQGTLLASKILGQLAMNNGYEVRVSEVHGMRRLPMLTQRMNNRFRKPSRDWSKAKRLL